VLFNQVIWVKKAIVVLGIGLIVLIGAALILSLAFSGAGNFSFKPRGIAIIPVKGEIVLDGSAFSQEMTAIEISNAIEEAVDNPSIGAIFLEINSGGGSAVASRQVVETVRIARESKPVVSWISEMGASGGYYIAASSDYIVADYDSFTGSIGAVSAIANVEGLLEKLGVEVQIVKAGDHKAMGSMFKGLTEGEQQLFQTIVEDSFLRFKQDIIDFRGDKLNQRQFDVIADGRIISGQQALGYGLVDEIGTRKEAIAIAAGLAQISDPIEFDFGKSEPSVLELFTSAGYSFGLGFKQGMLHYETGLRS